MDLLEIGQVVNTHGVRGEIKLNPWTDYLDDLLDIETFYYVEKGQTLALTVEQIRIHKNCAIIKAEGINTMSEAEAFRGKTLLVEREEELPEGRYYIADLIGLTVISEGEEFGVITDVFQTGANDVYEVRRQGAPKAYLPAIHQVIREINIKEGFVKVQIPEGLLDD